MIYIHIPFCASHCTYCAFYSELLRPCRQGSDALLKSPCPVPDEFVDTLCKEMQASAGEYEHSSVKTLYLGGGTPSLLSPGQLGRIISTAERLFGPFEEITMEVNPEDIVSKGTEYAAGLAECGVNRISMGVQSFDDGVLKTMGRRHRSAASIKAFSMLREAGFSNISLDFIFGLSSDPRLENISDALRALPSLPEHLSCYQLSVEDGSALSKMLERGLVSLPDDDCCAARYKETCEALRSLGYVHYEVSNWSLPGFRSRHNSAYWVHEPYLGFGPGAHSLLRTPDGFVRRWNKSDYKSWQSCGKDFSMVREQETLSVEQLREERIMLGLRTMEGVPEDLLDVDSSNSECAQTVLVASDGRVRIAEDKWFVSDNIIVRLI